MHQNAAIAKHQPAQIIMICLVQLLLMLSYSFIMIKMPDILLVYMGYTEYNTHQLFLSFIALLYACAILGGLASYWINYKNIIVLGIALCIAGLALITITPDFLFIGLACYLVGAGLVQPNIFVHTSRIYTTQHYGRGIGLLAIYVVANIAFISAVTLTGLNFVKHLSAYQLLLALALNNGLALAIYLILVYNKASAQFIFSCSWRKKLPIASLLLVIIAFSILGVSIMLRYPEVSHWLLASLMLASFVYLVLAIYRSDLDGRLHYALIMALIVCNIVYWVTNTVVTSILASFLPFALHLLSAENYNYSITAVVTMQATIIVIIGAITMMIYASGRQIPMNTLVNTVGLGISALLVCVALLFFSAHAHLPEFLNKQGLMGITILTLLAIAEITISPAIIILFARLIARSKEGLMFAIYQISIGLSIMVGGRFLYSVSWTKQHFGLMLDTRYYLLLTLVLTITFAGFVIYFGLLKPIWQFSQLSDRAD